MKENEQNEKIEFTDEENKLLKKYIEEYNDLYQKILILPESDLFENIQNRVEIMEKSKFKNYSPKSLQIIKDYLKEKIYIPDYKFALVIKKNILNRTKRELALHYFRGEIIPHCSGDKKDDYYIHTCGERFQFFRYKLNNNIPNISNNNLNHHHGIHYDYILFCIKCDMIYKSSLIKFKCYTNDTEFYSKLLIDNEDSKSKKNYNRCYATWKKYHCNAIINDTMKCDICEESYIFMLESNLLYCPNCKIKKNPLDITWKCLICQKDFQTEAKIYNPLEYKSLKICVKEAIVNKIKAKPEYMGCKCDIDINATKFFHKSTCKGELYLGEINSQKVVVCGKCDTLGLYEGYIWTCPICIKRFKTKKREGGSVCTKLGLIESTTNINKGISSKAVRNLSEKNYKKSGKQNNNDEEINDINNYLNDKNNHTISNHDNNILNYLNDIKDSMNINNINKINESKSSKDNNLHFSNINMKRLKNPTFQKLFTNSFIEDKNNLSISKKYKSNNFSFSEKSITDLNNRKEIVSNNSFNSKICNSILSGNSRTDITSKEKEEYSNDSKLKSSRYIINNYKKKSNFQIKNNFHLNTENKEKDENLYSNLKKKNIPFSLIKINQKFEKNQSESKDKKDMKSEEFVFNNKEDNLNFEKISSYRKPYYSINNSFINTFYKENNQLNDNRKSERIIKSNKKDNFNIENKEKDALSYTMKKEKNGNEVKEYSSNIKENLIKGKLCSVNEETKKKYKKKNKGKKYIYNSKDVKPLKKGNKIIAKALNFAEMSIKNIDNDKNNYTTHQNEGGKKNNNQKMNQSIKLRKNNNININININNSSNNINENEENINDIHTQKRIFSNSIIMPNLTINDKNNILNSFNFDQNNNINKNRIILGKNNMNNINSINNINTNININNINNNLHYYNQINNNINCLNNNLNNRKSTNYPTSYKKKINNKNSESTMAETEQNKKKIKSNISVNNLNKNDNNINQEYLLNQKFSNFSEYKIIKQIGKGTFGQIFMVQNNQHQYFALKKLIATNLKDIKTLEHEYQILLDIQSHGKKINLVQIYGIETKQLDPTTFVMYVLMELASTDWEKEILTRHTLNKYYSENELMSIISSLITTFAQLQKEKISHRDIKPQNILIFNDSKTYKLADFGEAKELLGDDKPTERQTLRGTELYMSPILFYALRSRQIIKYVKHNLYKSDLFSFGLCCLFASTLCFDSIYDVRELRNNTAIRYIIQKYLGNRYSNVVINIICSMLDVNENSRNDFIEMEKEIKKIGY